MGISNSKIWSCKCDVCGNVEEGLAIDKSDFVHILKADGWTVTENGIRAFCSKCKT